MDSPIGCEKSNAGLPTRGKSVAPRRFRALYIHVPFCRSKCDYCAFYSIPGAAPGLRKAWLDRVDNVELPGAAAVSEPLQSVYIGGGTPTVLTPAELVRLGTAVWRHFKPADDCEITAECNPESLDGEKAAALKDVGVNRVSLGVQSFSQRQRCMLGRHGNPESAGTAMRILCDAGIGNLGADMIYGIPGQSLEEWTSDLRHACELGVSHLSTYALTTEEGSRLARQSQQLPSDDLTVDMWEAAEKVAAEANLKRYEISNFAAPGKECRHNVDIWHGGTYAGCGPSATSFDGRDRWTNPADLDAWLNGAEPRRDVLPPEKRAAEILAFGMRTVAGWDVNMFRATTGHDAFALRGNALAKLRDRGLLKTGGQRIRPTTQGLLFADTVAAELL